ncbi:hypothetical protein RintRC_4895 [Richelia intracellularis]|nr:hypothetical protein RintRC_4895 [Richelia intracellularis]
MKPTFRRCRRKRALREYLKRGSQTIQNQLGKTNATPTLR